MTLVAERLLGTPIQDEPEIAPVTLRPTQRRMVVIEGGSQPLDLWTPARIREKRQSVTAKSLERFLARQRRIKAQRNLAIGIGIAVSVASFIVCGAMSSRKSKITYS